MNVSISRIRKLFLILMVLLPIGYTNASEVDEDDQKKVEIVIYFELDSSVIDTTKFTNAKDLNDLNHFLNRLRTDDYINIEKVEINSYTSPENGVTYNKRLSEARAQSTLKYILDNRLLSEEQVKAYGRGIAWEALREDVVDSDTPYKEQVIDILDNVPEETWARVKPNDKYMTLVDSRLGQLMDLKGGIPYKYMAENIFPYLRSSSVIAIYYVNQKDIPMQRIGSITPPEQQSLPGLDKTMYEYAQDNLPILKKPIFALKTNLLFDALTVLNVELEVPIKERWSVLGEWTFPWWLAKNNTRALQYLNGNVEGRYWFGDRSYRQVMTGWFGGAYAGAGKYDFENNSKGYQGEYKLSVGLTAGYAHKINRKGTLRMEYSLGLGYVDTDYRKYKGSHGDEFLIWQNDGVLKYFGPTRAKVSFVWMLFAKRKGVAL